MARCPLLSRCASKVDLDKYLKVCSNLTQDAFKDCPDYKRASQELKTPLEWDRLFTSV